MSNRIDYFPAVIIYVGYSWPIEFYGTPIIERVFYIIDAQCSPRFLFVGMNRGPGNGLANTIRFQFGYQSHRITVLASIVRGYHAKTYVSA